MAADLVTASDAVRDTGCGARNLPALVSRAGSNAQKRFIELFAAQIRNKNTREDYRSGPQRQDRKYLLLSEIY